MLHECKVGANTSIGASIIEAAIKEMIASRDPGSPSRGFINEAEVIDLVKANVAVRKVQPKVKARGKPANLANANSNAGPTGGHRFYFGHLGRPSTDPGRH